MRRLRVLQIAGSLHDWGGIERYVAYLREGLTLRGHHVDVARPDGSPLADRIEGPGVSVRGKLDRSAYRRYRQIIRDGRYDVVHAHFSPDFLVAGLAAQAERVPLRVLTRHVALPWSGAKAWQYRTLWPHAIAVSQAVEAFMHRAGYDESHCETRYAGQSPLLPTTPSKSMRAQWGVEENGFLVGSFGRLTREKGVDVLIRAMAHVPEATLLIFGSGPAEADLRDIANESSGQIRFMGRVEDVADAMGATDVLAVPSRWAEAFPFSALEAMSLGKPVIASRMGGLPEQVVEGGTGLLFPNEDSEQLAVTIRSLVASPELRTRMGKAAAERYRQMFTLDAFAERVEGFYLRRL